jgi:hypothetical protein
LKPKARTSTGFSVAARRCEPNRERQDDDPGAVVRQEHEAEVAAALQRGRRLIGLAGRSVGVAEQAFDDEAKAEGEEQAVKRIELAQVLQKDLLDDEAGNADKNGRQNQRPPIAEPDAEVHRRECRRPRPGEVRDQNVEAVEQKIGGERAHHVLGAMGEIDDVEHAENDGKPEAQQRVERAIDQPEQQLPEQGLRRNAENFEHALPHPAACRCKRPFAFAIA